MARVSKKECQHLMTVEGVLFEAYLKKYRGLTEDEVRAALSTQGLVRVDEPMAKALATENKLDRCFIEIERGDEKRYTVSKAYIAKRFSDMRRTMRSTKRLPVGNYEVEVS